MAAIELKNIGPKTSKQLEAAGIYTKEDLIKLGAEKAFVKIYAHCGGEMEINALYLYALEGAIYDCDYRFIPEKRKKEFREFTKNMKKELKKI